MKKFLRLVVLSIVLFLNKVTSFGQNLDTLDITPGNYPIIIEDEHYTITNDSITIDRLTKAKVVYHYATDDNVDVFYCMPFNAEVIICVKRLKRKEKQL